MKNDRNKINSLFLLLVNPLSGSNDFEEKVILEVNGSPI